MRVCRLPLEYKERATVPWLTVVREAASGTTLALPELTACLERHSDLIEAWLTYSADQRTSPAWYFQEAADGSFTTGFYPTGPTYGFSSAAEACALFIHKVLSSTLSL